MKNILSYFNKLLMRKKTVKIELITESGFLEQLEYLAEESRSSKAEVIDRAIGLYAQALKEAKEGRVIQFVEFVQDQNEI